MTIYEPVTDIGKAIAKALTRDDGIRLDVHDILERWEPEYIADMEKAEKGDEMKPVWDRATDIITNELMRSAYDLQQAQKKLEAVKELTMGHHLDEQRIHPLKILKILEAED